MKGGAEARHKPSDGTYLLNIALRHCALSTTFWLSLDHWQDANATFRQHTADGGQTDSSVSKSDSLRLQFPTRDGPKGLTASFAARGEIPR
jgi:hypothetical protein